MMNRLILFAAALTLPLALPISAFAASAAAQPIETLDNTLVGIMKAGSQNQSFMQRYDMLRPVVEKAFNMPRILQDSVGLEWAQIPEAQQAQLLKVFTQYTVASYIYSFNSYHGQSFRTLPDIRNGGADIVQTELVPPQGAPNKPTKLNYVMSDNNGQWQATDILFEGTISKVATTRSDFSSLVSNGNAMRLIMVLQRKVTALSGGALKS